MKIFLIYWVIGVAFTAVFWAMGGTRFVVNPAALITLTLTYPLFVVACVRSVMRGEGGFMYDPFHPFQ